MLSIGQMQGSLSGVCSIQEDEAVKTAEVLAGFLQRFRVRGRGRSRAAGGGRGEGDSGVPACGDSGKGGCRPPLPATERFPSPYPPFLEGGHVTDAVPKGAHRDEARAVALYRPRTSPRGVVYPSVSLRCMRLGPPSPYAA